MTEKGFDYTEPIDLKDVDPKHIKTCSICKQIFISVIEAATMCMPCYLKLNGKTLCMPDAFFEIAKQFRRGYSTVKVYGNGPIKTSNTDEIPPLEPASPDEKLEEKMDFCCWQHATKELKDCQFIVASSLDMIEKVILSHAERLKKLEEFVRQLQHG